METVYAVAGTIARHLWSVSWQVSILIGIIGIISILSRKSSSHFQYWLWSIVLFRLCIPLNLSLSSFQILRFKHFLETHILYSHGLTAPLYLPDILQSFSSSSLLSITSNYHRRITELYLIQETSFLPLIITLIWLIALITISVLLIRMALRTYDRLNRCPLIKRKELNDLLQKIAGEINVRQKVQIRYTLPENPDYPLVTGIINPVIYLPEKIADKWHINDLKPVLFHELVHIKRHDLLMNLIQVFIQVVYFFHPLVWVVNRHIRKLREDVCDDTSIQMLDSGKVHYIQSILNVIEESFKNPAFRCIGIGFMEKNSTIKRRVRRIMSTNYRLSKRLSFFSIAFLAVIGIIGVLFSCNQSPMKDSITETKNILMQKKGADISIPKEFIIRDEPLSKESLSTLAGMNGENVLDVPVTIATAWGKELVPPADFVSAVENIASAVELYSIIEVTYNNQLYLDSPDLLKTAVLFISADKPFTLTQTEEANFENYLRNGGFVVVNNSTPEVLYSDTEASLRMILNNSNKEDFKTYIVPVPNDHPLFHTYFDFLDGPPSGDTWPSYHQDHFIEGLYHGDRGLYALYYDYDYTQKWNEESGPQKKFGVNMVIYGLLREGGIMQKKSLESQSFSIKSETKTNSINIEIVGDGLYRVKEIQVTSSELQSVLHKEMEQGYDGNVIIKGSPDMTTKDIVFAEDTAFKTGAKGIAVTAELGKKLEDEGLLTVRLPRNTKLK